ncbi:actin-binding WH2 domain-containing protein [bacterium]|nr:MAG: actin-binding WH2 domain-containing protein [bacterium]
MNKGVFPQLLRNRDGFYDGVLTNERIAGIILRLLLGCVILFGIYGIVMGAYNSPFQAISSAIKVPVLFLLALIICYPALFIFNILLGSKLSLGQSLALLLSAFALSSCILASFAPIALFFMLIGSSYAFLRLLHVAIFAVAGLAGMKTLNDGLVYACEKYSTYPRQGVRVFKVWIIIFAFVGTQLAWNLRPFLGNRDMEFQLFRKQEGNFYSHIIKTTRGFIFGKKSEPASRPKFGGLDGATDIERKVNEYIDSVGRRSSDAR